MWTRSCDSEKDSAPSLFKYFAHGGHRTCPHRLVTLQAPAGQVLLLRTWTSGGLHELVASAVRRQVAIGQRLYFLSSMPSLSPRDWQTVLSEVLPPSVNVMVGAQGPRDAFMRIAAAKSCAADDSRVAKHLGLALEWLRQPQLALGYEDQLQLYGLAQQASKGDYPRALQLGREELGTVAREQHEAWQTWHGLSREEAAVQLVCRLAEFDPGFSSAHPQIASDLPPPQMPAVSQQAPGAEWMRILCELLERRLPQDLDKRIHHAKRRVSVGLLGSYVLYAILKRMRRTTQWRRLAASVHKGMQHVHAGKFLGTCISAYLLAINIGLPPAVHARLPRLLRELPARAARLVEPVVGGSAPRLCRLAMQALLPPVRGSLFFDL